MQDAPEKTIAIDASFLGAAGGIGSYTWGLLKAYAAHFPSIQAALLSNALPQRIPQYQSVLELERKRLPALPGHWRQIRSSDALRLWWSAVSLPRTLRRVQPGVYHALDSISTPLWDSPCPSILTVHDILPLTHPQYSRGRDAWAAKLFMPRAMAAADCIVTDSRYSASEIVRRFPAFQNKVRVVYPGVDREVFCPGDGDLLRAESALGKWGLSPKRYFFSVMTLNPRRNLERLMQAFSVFARTSGGDIVLAVAGCRGWKDHPLFDMVAELRLETCVQFLGFASDEDLAALYQSALAVVVPSLAEGFGFPVVEGMACGVPVICSSTTSLGEISGDAALLIDPTNVDSIAEALALAANDEALRARLIQSGLKHIEQFSWKRAASEMISIYREFTS